MGFRRSRNNNWKRNNGERKDERKGRARPKLALVGAIALAVGILLIFYTADVRELDYATMIGGIFVMAGTVMLLLSLSKKNRIRLDKGMNAVGKAFRDNCQCCKCQNCGRNHNHWVHDDSDTRRRHY